MADSKSYISSQKCSSEENIKHYCLSIRSKQNRESRNKEIHSIFILTVAKNSSILVELSSFVISGLTSFKEDIYKIQKSRSSRRLARLDFIHKDAIYPFLDSCLNIALSVKVIEHSILSNIRANRKNKYIQQTDRQTDRQTDILKYIRFETQSTVRKCFEAFKTIFCLFHMMIQVTTEVLHVTWCMFTPAFFYLGYCTTVIDLRFTGMLMACSHFHTEKHNFKSTWPWKV